MKLSQAAREIAANPAALELRRMQMVAEVGIEHNTTTIILLPSDFLSLANALTRKFGEQTPGSIKPTCFAKLCTRAKIGGPTQRVTT